MSVAGLTVSGSGQGISLKAANGMLSVQNSLSASGNVTLASGRFLKLGTVESRDGSASVTGGAEVQIGTLAGKTAASARGTTLSVGTVRGGTVTLRSTTGDLSLGTVTGTAVTATSAAKLDIRGSVTSTAGDITLLSAGDLTAKGLLAADGGALTATSSGALSVTGGARSRGDIRLTGATLTLDGAQSADGAYVANATAGDITGRSGLSIVSDADGTGGGTLSLMSAGAITLASDADLTGGLNGDKAVQLTTGGEAVTIGDVRGGSLSITAGTVPVSRIVAGNLTLGGNLNLSAVNGIRTGAIGTGTGTIKLNGGTGR